MKLRLMLAFALVLAAALPAAAQRATISPGMTADQVRQAFGGPATTREAGEWTYWYYHNGCPVRCGSDDVVFFQGGRVVAAVLRTGARRFAGPGAADLLEETVPAADRDAAERANPGRARTRTPARVGGVRVNTPGGVQEEEGEGEEQGSRRIIIRGRDAALQPLRSAGAAAEADSLGPAEPATAVDDERRAREGRIEPNTVRPTVSPDTANADRRARERRVQPRVVPRGGRTP